MQNLELNHKLRQMVDVEVVCAICGGIYTTKLPDDYVNNPFVWRKHGILVKDHADCWEDAD